MTVRQEHLVDAFSDCVGREKAADVIADVTAELGLDGASLEEDQAIEVAVQVANQPDTTPFVRTAANTLQTRIRTGNL